VAAVPSPGAAAGWCADGILNGDACCPAACGQCGGGGCGQAPGGADQCCSGRVSNYAPTCETVSDTACVVPDTAPVYDDPSPPPATEPAPPAPPVSPPFRGWCADGIQNGQACCALACGQCGGGGCGGAPGGAEQCCKGKVISTAPPCESDADTVCVVPNSPPPSPPSPPPSPPVMPAPLPPPLPPSPSPPLVPFRGWCFLGISNGQACCPAACGQCGGGGCGQAPGGGSQCCKGQVINSGVACATDADTACVIPS